MTAEIVELEEISVCPECHSREWIVVKTRSSGGPFCRCANCDWQDLSLKDTEKTDG